MRVIEDDDCPRRKLVSMLDNEALTVFETCRGEAALARSRQHVAIVEIRLTNRMSGDSIVRGIRNYRVLRSVASELGLRGALYASETGRGSASVFRAYPQNLKESHAMEPETRLLTIDDDERLRRSIRVYFEDSGMTVFEAADGRTGLTLFAEKRPDIVLVDLTMPGMHGLDVIKELAGMSPETPAIVVSGTADLSDAVEAVHRGVWDFVTKPIVSMMSLEHTVRQCLDRARLKKENELYRLHLEQLVARRTEEVRRTRLQIIQRLGRAAEYRDNETGMHVIRISHVSRLLALRAGLSDARAETLMNASPMHDVGKIGIPDQILLKPGKLLDDEWEIMMTHAQIGADIIGDDPSEIMHLAALIALNHHEKWDGSGYPNGLRGENIPIEARIVAIADVFDALTSRRPYKEAWPEERALDHIREGAGAHFDPQLVPLFMEIVPEIRAIRHRYHD